MPIKLADIVAEQRWIPVDIAGEEVQVAYTPNTITLRRSHELEQMMKRLESDPDIDTGVEMARMFCDLVADWDIIGGDNEPYPIDVEALQDFPANILTMILQAVQDDVAGGNDPKATPNGNSGAGSSPRGSLEPARNGTH